MANPFSVQSINPLQSLMALNKGFETTRGFLRDDLELQDRARLLEEQQRARGRDQSAFAALLDAAYGGGGQTSYTQDPGRVGGAFNRLDETGGYFNNIRAAESGGNDTAANPRSTALGRYQFTQGTWNDLARRYPDLGLTPDGRADPAQQERAIRAFTAENARALKAHGLQTSPGNLYATHFLGAGDGPRVLQSPDDTALAAILSPEVLHANPSIARMNAGQFKRFAAGKAGGGQQQQAQQAANGLPSREQMQAILASPETRKLGIEMLQAAREGREPDNVVIGQRLVNKSTGQVVADFTGDGKIKPTSDIQEYQFAQSQGFPGSFLEYMNAKRGKGTSLTVNPDGTINFSQGGAANPGNVPLGKPAAGETEKSVLAIDEQLRGLDDIAQTYSDDFLTYQGQAGAALDSIANKAGVKIPGTTLGSGERAAKRRPFIEAVNRMFNAYRKEITGAAAAVQELDRLKAAMLNEDLSPAEFKASYDTYKGALLRSREALLRARTEGLRPNETNALIDQAVLDGQSAAAPARVQSDADYDALPSGAEFIAPDGSRRRKP